MKKISVIVPLYNGEKTIRRCIDSILAQTYSNFEILVINDGSTDKSSEIVSEMMRDDSRIVLVNKSHEGVSAARNIGLLKTTGELLQFIDADDYIEPDM
ncbi:MAG: glycosyltransferase family A protein, partial [Eubacteriales bacterium]|nr:glycosyltransferase family A protein [Eubacteriales bacterium]